MAHQIEVLPFTFIPRPHRGVFSYEHAESLPKGALVEVPLGKRTFLGIVWSGKMSTSSKFRLKKIIRVVSKSSVFSSELLDFLVWQAESNASSLGLIFHKASRRLDYFLPSGAPHLSRHKTAKRGVVKHERFICGFFDKRVSFYADLIKKNIKNGGQVLVLAPTKDAQSRILQALRSQRVPVFWASSISGLKGDSLFKLARQGKSSVASKPFCVVGGKNDLDFPFASLKLVILDDEQNELWKETREHPFIDGRISAFALAGFWKAEYVSGSFFQPIASFAKKNIDKTNCSPRKNSDLIRSYLINLREEAVRNGLSARLTKIISESSRDKKSFRAIIFVNRKGLASALTCLDCGFVFTCNFCSASMPIFQKLGDIKKLRCRHCGREFISPLVCPSCRGLKLMPKGLAANAVEDFLKKSFSKIWIGRLDSSLAPTLARQNKIVEEFKRHKKAVLVATSMALNKHLPSVDVAAVAVFEQLLAAPDFNIEENVFTLLARLKSFIKPKGDFFIQTWHLENELLKFILRDDFNGFAKKELALRKKFGWPPYRRIAKLTLARKDNNLAVNETVAMAKKFKKLKCEIVGPFPAFINMKKGKYIWHVVLKWRARDIFDVALEKKLAKIVPASWDIDINPSSIL